MRQHAIQLQSKIVHVDHGDAGSDINQEQPNTREVFFPPFTENFMTSLNVSKTLDSTHCIELAVIGTSA